MKLFLSLSLFLWSFLVNCWTYPQNYVEEVFKWKSVTYENLPLSEYSWIGPYPYYIPENNDISSMAFHPASGLMIVNVLRIRPGIPSTLNAFCVNEYTVGSSPKLWGFPNYNVNTLRSSDFERQSDDHDDIDFRKYHKKPNKHGQNNYYHESHSHYGGSQDHHLVYQKPYYYTPKPTTTWSATKKPNYDLKRIISAYTTTVSEKCNRVYTIDTGVLDYNRSYTNILQKPAILIFDLQSDCCETRTFPLVRRSEYPDDIARSFPFGNIYFNLDYQSDDCDDLFIYISNPFTNTIIVYDYKRDDYWFFNNHPSFAPVIVESHMVFDKDFFYDLPIGIIHLALGYPDKYGDRTAYYIAGASTAQFSVSTAVLKDKSNAPSNYNVDDFKIMGYRGCESQAIITTVDYTNGVVFYAEIQSNRVRCWNMKKPLNPDNIGVVYESEKMLFGIQIFIDSRGYLWFLSSHLPIIFISDQPLNLKEVNSEIFRIKVSDAIRGTVCEDEDRYRLDDILY